MNKLIVFTIAALLILGPTIVRIGRDTGSGEKNGEEETGVVELARPKVAKEDLSGEVRSDREGRSTRGYETDEKGGGWYQGTREDLSQCLFNKVAVAGRGPEATVNLSSVDGEGWAEVRPETHPDSRYGHDMAHSVDLNKVVLFGGYDGGYKDDTWLFDIESNTWSEVRPSPAPSARFHHKMVYVSGSNKVMLFGGYFRKSDTWLYDVEKNLWSRQNPNPHPPNLYRFGMVYDGLNDKVVLFGGRYYYRGWHFMNETWAYDVGKDRWTEKEPAVSPSARFAHDMAYDPVQSKVVLFGGHNGSYRNDTWIYDLGTDEWTEVETRNTPPRRGYHSMVYDREIHKIVMFGGYPYDSRTWLFDTLTNTWSSETYDESPPRRYASSMTHDTVDRKSLLFGGIWGTRDDTWIYDRERYSTSGVLTSPVVRKPEGYEWDRVSVDKNEIPGTYINLSVINAVTSSPVPGFDKIPGHNIDISDLNELDITTIRLKATFKGTEDKTPALDSWGVQWKRSDLWYDGFVGDGGIAGVPGSDKSTAALWHFDDGKGQVLTDSSKAGNNGTLGGGDNLEPSDPNWVVSRFGGGLRFDGTDDYVWVKKDRSLQPDNSLSVEAWFKADRMEKGVMGILGGRSDGDYALQVSEKGQVRFLISTIDLPPNEYNELVSTTVVRPDRWYHVAFTFQRPEMKLYVNGKPEDEATVDYPVRHTAVPLFLGAEVGSARFPYDPSDHFGGIIDELRISNATRSEEEIARNARRGLSVRDNGARLAANRPRPASDTVLLYDFEKVEGQVVIDSGGNSLYGILRGASYTPAGKYGGGMVFDGADDHIEVFDSPNFHLPAATYELRIRWEGGDGDQILFFEKKPGGNDTNVTTNEMGKIDASGRIHYLFDNDTYDIVSEEEVPLNEWTHLAFVRSGGAGGTAKIYVDGEESGSGSFSDLNHTNREPLLIGGNGTGNGSFKGTMDELVVRNTAPDPETVGENAGEYVRKAVFRSKDVKLPGWDPERPEERWNTFFMESVLPDDTELNVTLRDPDTDEVLKRIPINNTSVSADLGEINVLLYPELYILAELTGTGTATPVVSGWGIDRGEIEPPYLTENISKNILVVEDTPQAGILNLSDHFHDAYRHIEEPVYTVETLSGPAKINLSLRGALLDVDSLEENWTGTVKVIVTCTNLYGRNVSSPIFNITVTGVNDAPIWVEEPPPIRFKEDRNASLDLGRYVFDAEGDPLNFSVESDNENITVVSSGRNTISVAGTADYSGAGLITATVYESESPALNATVTVPVFIEAVNDPPYTVLRSPGNNSVVTDTDVTFFWDHGDVDSPPGNITYDLHLSKASPPLIYQSDLDRSPLLIEDLDDGATYYWKVVPSDGISEGSCLNGTWSFTVNTTVLYPETRLTYPENGSVINITSFNLSWEGKNPTNRSVLYHVYMGGSGTNLSEIGLTRNTSFPLGNLTNNTTYFWRVIPVAGDTGGPCISGIWSFHVDTSFEAKYNLTFKIEPRTIRILQGENATVNITIENGGNVPVKAVISTLGDLSSYVIVQDWTYTYALEPGERIELKMLVTNTRILEPRYYELKITVDSPGGTKGTILEVTIVSAEGDGRTTQEAGTRETLWLWGAVLVLALIVVGFVISVIRKRREERRREEREEPELIDAEIVRPQPPPPPGLPSGKGYPALPQYFTGAGYGMPGTFQRQLGQQGYTGPNAAEAPKQLPPAEHIPPPPPDEDEEKKPEAAPTPSVVLPDLDPRADLKPDLKRLPPAPKPASGAPGPIAPTPSGAPVQKSEGPQPAAKRTGDTSTPGARAAAAQGVISPSGARNNAVAPANAGAPGSKAGAQPAAKPPEDEKKPAPTGQPPQPAGGTGGAGGNSKYSHRRSASNAGKKVDFTVGPPEEKEPGKPSGEKNDVLDALSEMLRDTPGDGGEKRESPGEPGEPPAP